MKDMYKSWFMNADNDSSAGMQWMIKHCNWEYNNN